MAVVRFQQKNKTLAVQYIISRMTAGATQGEVITEVAGLLSAYPTSDPDWGILALRYNTDNVAKLVDNLVGDTVNADDRIGAVDYILAQMANGQTFGQMIDWAISALDGMDHSDTVWGNAATLFDNRIEVSRYYTVEKAGSSTNLATLQQVLASVTADVATVATAKTAIDNLLNNSAVFDLSNLNGNNGFRIDGILTSDQTGRSVNSAGDINGDGFDDLIVGAYNADPNGDDSGAGYIVFGKASGFGAMLSLSDLNGSNGFFLNGSATSDQLGTSASSAGDVNNDGFDDLIIGAPFGDGSVFNSGTAYVLFGHRFATEGTSLKLFGSGDSFLNNYVTDALDKSAQFVGIPMAADFM